MGAMMKMKLIRTATVLDTFVQKKSTFGVSLLFLLWVFFSVFDGDMYPVVRDFRVTESTTSYAERVNKDGTVTPVNRIAVQGSMHITRACVFTGVHAAGAAHDGTPVVVDIRFRDTQRGDAYSRGKGLHKWGVWVVDVTEDVQRVDLSVVHRCHPFWLTETDLTSFFTTWVPKT